MHIIHVNASYKPAYIYGGPTRSVSRLCEAITSSRLPVSGSPYAPGATQITLEVLTTTANGASELPVVTGVQTIVDGVPVTYFPRITKDHTHLSFALLKGLKKVMRKHTIVHIHAWWNLTSILSCLVAKRSGVPVVLSPRGMVTAYTLQNRNGIFKKLIHFTIGKRLLENCHIHVTSEKEKNDVLGIINPKQITVIPNLVSFPAHLREGRTGSEVFRLIFLSRVEEKKGLELLFEALTRVDFRYTLTIAGSGETGYVDALKQRSEQLGIARHVTWAGEVANDEKFNLFLRHDLLCLTSYNENFANVVIESLSVGTPVLVSSEVGLSDYVAQHELGWVCGLNPAEIARRLDNAFSDEQRRLQIQEKAPGRIKTDFSPGNLVEHYIRLYQSIIE